MEKQGVLEWIENGKVVQKNFEAIVVQYPSGIVSAPQKFQGRLILADDTTERQLLVFIPGSQPFPKAGVPWRKPRWTASRWTVQQKVGLFAWTVLLIMAIYRNLSHYFGF